MRVGFGLIVGGLLVTACGTPAAHWRGGTPVCVTKSCPAHGSLTTWSAVSVSPDDQTLIVRVPTACGDVNGVQPVKVAQNPDNVVIGFFGQRLAGGICASSATVTFRLAAPVGHRAIYDAKTGNQKRAT